MLEKTYIKCNICDSSKYIILYKDELGDDVPPLDYNFSPKSRKTYQIVKCNSCGLIYTNPMPMNIYAFYKDTVDEIYLATKKQRLQGAKKVVQEILKFKKGGNLLDIGCATGYFLDVASEYFNVTGIELSEWAFKEAAKRHEVYNMPLSGIEFTKKFDVITLFGVIEHLTNPSKELDLISSCLKQSGLVVIYTPDIGGWLPRLLGKKWWNFMGMHLYYFSKETCKGLLEKCGFSVIKIMNYTHYFQLNSLGISMKRYHIGKIVSPILNLPFIKDIIIPLKLSGEMLVFALKRA